MFALPQMVGIPGFGVGAGSFEWPWLGALFAWVLVAALVGSSLALLRSYSAASAGTAPRSNGLSVDEPLHSIENVPVVREHRQAA
jgi:hypothetical protein